MAGVIVLLMLLAAGGWAGWRRLGTPAAGLALPDKPSVAVLPFTNLSRDPAQEYFSDGVTEDLITGLSKISGLFVIARNSAFTYKGQAVKVGEVARDLGVRYVLEGSVQRADSRVRITAQLVDAATGYHVWAERYDREVRDIFALQDEVTREIVRALAVRLKEGEQRGLGRTQTNDLDAYDLVLRGQEERRRTTREANLEAGRLFAKARDLDPGYARAYEGLSWVELQSWQLMWSTDPQSLERARELAERAVALDDTLAGSHHLLGQIYLWKKDHDRAIREAERAVAIAPNDAAGYEALAEVLAWAGQPEDSIKQIRLAMRLNPHYPFFYLWTLGHAYYVARRNRDAADAFNKALEQNPNFLPARAYLAAALTEMGQAQRAQEAWDQARQLSPHPSLLSLRQSIRERLPYRRPADLERFLTALAKFS